MYAVVGCSDCQALWLVEDSPATTECPRCGRRHQFDRLKQFVTTDDEDHAREVRASMLAARSDHGDAFAELDSFAELEEELADAGIDDEAYLDAKGVDVDAVNGAAERAEQGRASGGTTGRQAIVRAALEELDEPTEPAVIDYTSERGVPPEYVRRALEKLVQAGEVSESNGRYRLL
ncbi:MAG: DUF5817 domain-containing protein [Halobacteriales archaeon]